MGVYQNSAEAFLNQALHFNGRKWSMVKTPDPAGKGSDDFNYLSKVACVKASDCWAVGYTESGDSAPYLNEALHFNGKKWSVIKTPDPAGTASDDDNELSRVACVNLSTAGRWATQRAGAARRP